MQFVVFIRFLKAFLNEERSKIFFFCVEKTAYSCQNNLFQQVHNEDTFV